MLNIFKKLDIKHLSLIILIALFIFTKLFSLFIPQKIADNYKKNESRAVVRKLEKVKAEYEEFLKNFKKREKKLRHKIDISIKKEAIPTNEIIDIAKEFLKADEGIISCDEKNRVDFWLGRVFNPFPSFPHTKLFVVKNTRSNFISTVSELKVGVNRKLIFIKEFPAKHYEGVRVELIEWKDKFGNQELLKKEVLFERFGENIEVSSLLRTPEGEILGILKVRALELSFIINWWKNLFDFTCNLILLALLPIIVITYSKFFGKFKIYSFVFAIIFMRFLLIFIKKSLFFENHPLFKPELSAISPYSDFLNSPLDIFLTVLTISSILFLLFKFSFPLLQQEENSKRYFKFFLPLIFFFPLPLFIFQIFLKSLVHNTSRGLLYFLSPFPIFILLTFFFVSLSTFLLMILIFRLFYLSHKNSLLKIFLITLQIPLYYLFVKDRISLPFIPTILAFVLIAWISWNFQLMKKGFFFGLSILLLSFFIYFSLDHFLFLFKRHFIENDLKNLILAQKKWSEFILREGIKEIESQSEIIKNFLLTLRNEEIAYEIWLKTTASKLRWPSAIEIVDREGEILSSFSLNLPIPESVYTPYSDRWWVEETSLPFFDKTKRVKFGYKSILTANEWLGKVIFYISSDYDAIPILYRESPYYSILRGEVFPPSPVMERDFGFAVFDEEGSIIFNPSKITSLLERKNIERIKKEGAFWSSIKLPSGTYHIFYFESEDRIFSIFYPVKTLKGYCLELIEITLIIAIFSLILLFFLNSISLLKLPWLYRMTFSAKVRMIFLLIALLPFIVFSIFSNFFLQKLFIEQMKNKAIGELETAKGIFQQFYNVERENIIPQDLILWVGSIIARDINIYLNGLLIGSSRAEVFLSGYLPFMMDGEIFNKIIYKGTLYHLKKEKMENIVYFTLSSPLKLGDQTYIISIPLIPELKELSLMGRNFMEFLAIMFMFFALIATLVSHSLYVKIMEPIKTLLTALREVGRGNLKTRIETRRRDEIKELMEGFNSMVEELNKKQEELKEMERRQAWSEMAKKAAHEIKNPLTPMLLMAEHLQKIFRENPKEFEKSFEKCVDFIISEIKRLKRISTEFLSYSRELIFKENFDLKKLVDEIVEPLKITLKERVKIIVKSNQEEIFFHGDPRLIETIIRNIILNAIEAIKEKGLIEVELLKSEKFIRISIKDSGEGIARENLNQIFEPYFSTKPSGTGLGLSIAKKMVEIHRGNIFAESILGKGTSITVEFPVES